MVNKYRIAVLPGDGIGKEVIPEGLKLLEAVEKKTGAFHMQFDSYPWGSDYYLKTGRMMPEDALKVLADYDAIYLVQWVYRGASPITLRCGNSSCLCARRSTSISITGRANSCLVYSPR